jgi:hypothetical protein
MQSVLNYGTSGSVQVPLASIDDEDRIFNWELSYSKGACLVQMIRFIINDDSKFFGFLKHYQETFAFSTATTSQFQSLLEEYTNQDWSDFFNQWFYGEGYPKFQFSWCQDGGNLVFASSQTGTSNVTPLFKTPFDIVIGYSDGSDEKIRFEQNQNLEYFSYQIPQNKTISNLSLKKWLLASANFYPTDISAISQAIDDNIIIYPNPVKDIINFSVPLSHQTLHYAEIYDISGKLQFSTNLNGLNHFDTMSIDVSRLKQGNYYLKIGEKSVKFIKK